MIRQNELKLILKTESILMVALNFCVTKSLVNVAMHEGKDPSRSLPHEDDFMISLIFARTVCYQSGVVL